MFIVDSARWLMFMIIGGILLTGMECDVAVPKNKDVDCATNGRQYSCATACYDNWQEYCERYYK